MGKRILVKGIVYFLLSVLLLSTLLAEAEGAPLGDTMLDDFEQANGNNNTLNYWAGTWADTAHGSTCGFIPDVNWAAKNGSYGGCVYYKSNSSETAQCKFYSIFKDVAPFVDLSSATAQDIRFWIKANEGTPRISKVILEADNASIYGRVNFSTYNGGTDVVSSTWKEIIIPKSDFLGDVAGGFSLSRVKLFAITFVTNTNGIQAAILLDDIQLKAHFVPSASLSVQPTNVAGDGNNTGVYFNSVPGSTTYLAAAQYLCISYSDNYSSWKMETYTKNTGWSGNPSGYRGGMLGQTRTYYVVPLLYRGYDGKQTGGVPCGGSTGWQSISDYNDPSWQHGTTLIASGNAGHGYLQCPPNSGLEVTSPIYVYLGGNFTGQAAQPYSSTVYIELYHE